MCTNSSGKLCILLRTRFRGAASHTRFGCTGRFAAVLAISQRTLACSGTPFSIHGWLVVLWRRPLDIIELALKRLKCILIRRIRSSRRLCIWKEVIVEAVLLLRFPLASRIYHVKHSSETVVYLDPQKVERSWQGFISPVSVSVRACLLSRWIRTYRLSRLRNYNFRQHLGPNSQRFFVRAFSHWSSGFANDISRIVIGGNILLRIFSA